MSIMADKFGGTERRRYAPSKGVGGPIREERQFYTDGNYRPREVEEEG